MSRLNLAHVMRARWRYVADREHPCKSVRESVTVRHFEEVRFARRSFALAAASVAL